MAWPWILYKIRDAVAICVRMAALSIFFLINSPTDTAALHEMNSPQHIIMCRRQYVCV